MNSKDIEQYHFDSKLEVFREIALQLAVANEQHPKPIAPLVGDQWNTETIKNTKTETLRTLHYAVLQELAARPDFNIEDHIEESAQVGASAVQKAIESIQVAVAEAIERDEPAQAEMELPVLPDCTREWGHLPPCNGVERINENQQTCWRPYSFEDVKSTVEIERPTRLNIFALKDAFENLFPEIGPFNMLQDVQTQVLFVELSNPWFYSKAVGDWFRDCQLIPNGFKVVIREKKDAIPTPPVWLAQLHQEMIQYWGGSGYQSVGYDHDSHVLQIAYLKWTKPENLSRIQLQVAAYLRRSDVSHSVSKIELKVCE